MEEWRKVRLGDCIREINERTTVNNQYEVLTSSKNGIVSQEEYFEKQVASKNNIGYKIIKKGQFTYRSMSDSGSFTINRLENKKVGIVSPAYPVFEVIDINGEYLKYFFESSLFEQAIHNLSQGSTRTALKYKDLSNIYILLPSIKEQEKIIQVLKPLDLIINEINISIEMYEKRKKSAMKFVINNKNNKKMKVKDVADIYLGLTHKPKYVEEGIPFLSSQNVSNGYLDFENVKYITDDEFNKSSENIKPKKGDVLFSRVGSNLGNPVIVDSNVTFGIYVSLGYLRAKENVNNLYLKQWIDSEQFSRQVKTKVSGGAKNNINTGWLKEFFITIPDIKEQQKIAKTLEKIDEMVSVLVQKKEYYQSLKQAIMQQLLTGKVRVKI